LQNVFPFEIGILKQEFINAASGSNLSDDHAHGNANPASASLAAHHFWALCDAIQRFRDFAGLRRTNLSALIGALSAFARTNGMI
jgi:hypothetical protein